MSTPAMSPFPALFLLAFAIAFRAATADAEQDICVADLASGLKVNGYPCKDPASVAATDFSSMGLANFALTNNTVGSLITAAHVEKIPGLNTLGISMSRIDYAPGGLNPPHTHPRASELIFVLEGQLDVGFITTANKLISKTIEKGEVFVFPKGLVHFQKNRGKGPASVIAAFNSQLAGTLSLATTLFGASPAIPADVLSGTFKVGTKEVQKIRSRFRPKN